MLQAIKQTNGAKLPQKVGIIHSDVKRSYYPTEEQYITEKEAKAEAEIIASYLKKMGVEPVIIPANKNLSDNLTKHKPDMVLNFTGSINGHEYLASTVPGILEILKIPYSGAGILGESLNYNKFLTKDLLNSHGIPVPNFQLISEFNTPLYQNMRFPLISKLNEIHGSVEISSDAISENEKHLRERIKYLINTYKQDVLVEEFIIGKEVTVFLLEGLNKKVYMAEKTYDENDKTKYKIEDFDTVWLDDDSYMSGYKKYEDENLKKYIRKAFNVLRMDDYGKFDVRIDESGRYYFIDANTNPYLVPVEYASLMPLILNLYGVSFEEILRRLMINAMSVYPKNAETKEA